jgi:uncharacterized membrane protein
MDISIFLAKALGLVLFFRGTTIVLHYRQLRKNVTEAMDNYFLNMMLGIMVLVMGVLVVLSHSVWEGPAWVLLVTLTGWLMLIKGALIMLLPTKNLTQMIRYFNTDTWYMASGIISVILGAYLTYMGFTA